MSQGSVKHSAGVRRSRGATPAAQGDAQAIPLTVLGGLAEWTTLHHLLQEVLDAAAPFQAGIVTAERCGYIDSSRRREMFVNWRPCQDRIYRLVEFSEGIQRIGRPYRREARHLRGARWAVEIIALQLMIEETLSDHHPHPTALVELVDDFRTVCLCHLAIANREMRSLVQAQLEFSDALGRPPA